MDSVKVATVMFPFHCRYLGLKKKKKDNHVTRRRGSDPETARSLADNFLMSLPKIILHSETQ